jgi:hypothetical protein
VKGRWELKKESSETRMRRGETEEGKKEKSGRI